MVATAAAASSAADQKRRGSAAVHALILEEIDHARGDFTAAFRRYEAARVVRTARVQLDSRVLWEFYHAAGIARDVRQLTVADWTEQHMLDCLAWLYDGVPASNSDQQ